VGTPTAADTRAVGAALGGLLVPGDVVSLSGDLGAGKTTFVQGAAGALGVVDQVTSPTFVLVRQYAGRLPVAHVDVYRLSRVQEVLDLGFDELMDGSWVVFVEWGDVIDTLLPPGHLRVALSAGADDARSIDLSGEGPEWARRWGPLEAALGEWRAA
jgi:tRNA threonylcarbamoyladenosine biosynthesis protein TsaE